MKKQGLKSAEFEFDFPVEIIQHIQSLMCAKRAACTALLSKSWHRAWSTRPILCLDKPSSATNEEFGRFARKTMQRYEDQNLRLHTFTIRTGIHGNGDDEDDHALAVELIPRAFKLRAIHLEIQIRVRSAPLPDEVLQSEALASLSVYNCLIKPRIRKKTSCSNLKILKLSNLAVNPDVIRDLISGCPLLEDLTLESLRWGTKLPFDVSTLTKLFKLRYLRLQALKFGDSLFESELWPKFACLKELELSNFSHKGKVLRICSGSLERIDIITIEQGVSLNGEFDVPNLRAFVLYCEEVPLVELKTSGEREVDVRLRCTIGYREDRVPWCSSLKKAVERIKLCRSRVSLSILLYMSDGGDGGGYVADGLAIPVHKLEIMGNRGDPVFLGILEALLCRFRPRFVAIEGQCLFGIREVDVEGGSQQLRSLPWKRMLDASKRLLDASSSRGSHDFQFVRFQLK